MLALLLMAAGGQASELPSREERVLELLRGIAGQHVHYPRASFELAPAPYGDGPVVVPFVQISCGNSDCGTFDDARARRLGLDLCRIYGWQPARDQRLVEDGKSVLLDGLDPNAKLGFKLLGRGIHEMFAEALPEHPVTAMDEGEFEWLRAEGYQLHVAGVERYRCNDGDEFTPTLAYLAGLVRFLNDSTEGEDVDLGGLLFEREATWPWPAASELAVPQGIRAEGKGGWDLVLTAERAGTVRFACRGASEFGPPVVQSAFFQGTEIEHRGRPLGPTTAGAPSMLLLPCHPQGFDESVRSPDLATRLRQRIGGRELVHESPTTMLFLLSTFDLARPFELELDLEPGRYSFHAHARIGGAAFD